MLSRHKIECDHFYDGHFKCQSLPHHQVTPLTYHCTELNMAILFDECVLVFCVLIRFPSSKQLFSSTAVIKISAQFWIFFLYLYQKKRTGEVKWPTYVNLVFVYFWALVALICRQLGGKFLYSFWMHFRRNSLQLTQSVKRERHSVKRERHCFEVVWACFYWLL